MRSEVYKSTRHHVQYVKDLMTRLRGVMIIPTKHPLRVRDRLDKALNHGPLLEKAKGPVMLEHHTLSAVPRVTKSSGPLPERFIIHSMCEDQRLRLRAEISHLCS
jgi:hypothetical protein